MRSTSPLSFYIHIPYCIKRCGYCDFNTYTPAELGQGDLGRSEISSRYISAALKEIEGAGRELTSSSIGKSEVASIFFGGGTPSLMDPSDIARVIALIKQEFGLEKECEITLEANPDTLDRSNLAGFVDAGVNRLSMGVQSADAGVLATLDRTHRSENVSSAMEIARELGITSLSADLIYGTPGESMEALEKSIDFALSLPINHLSAYALIVEPGTKLARQVEKGEIAQPDDDEMAVKYELIDDRLSESGFDWYEVSNWAKSGGACRHNLNYWHGGTWWGVGPGAHSHLAGKRWWNIKSPLAYIDAQTKGGSLIAGEEILTDEQRADERIMLGIRLRNGLNLKSMNDAERIVLDGYVKSGAISQEDWDRGAVVLTLSGRMIADRIVRDLVV